MKKDAAKEDPKEADAAPQEGEKPAYNSLSREEFNRLAVRLNAPVYWKEDTSGDNTIDPNEVVTLRFYPTATQWVEEKDGAVVFNKAFEDLYAELVKCKEGCTPEGLDEKEAARRAAVIEELDQGRTTLVYNDLSKLGEDEKTFVKHMAKVGELMDQLYAEQLGIDTLAAKIPADDLASHSLFRRNWGPKCKGPRTESNPACGAFADPKAPVGIYPAEIQDQDKFCEMLAGQPNGEALMAPFTVVVKEGEGYKAVPFTEHYKTLTEKIAAELDMAAEATAKIASERALTEYLKAAAQSFRDNNWDPANEAWAKMNATNSRWYVRVAPDETYWEPCSAKAGAHLTFALINTESLEWQKKLEPVRQEMEDRFAALIGAPYEARTVAFHLPDFIDIVTNSGDDRDPFGATIGQSLPNWGPVANEGRGRTVAMSNLYTDADSMRIRRMQAESILHADTMAYMPLNSTPGLLSTILHEAAHNLGPAHEYKVDGKKDDQVFGGPLATTLEELKAQTAALWYIAFCLEKGIIDEKMAYQTYGDSIFWALGHISRGLLHRRKAASPLLSAGRHSGRLPHRRGRHHLRSRGADGQWQRQRRLQDRHEEDAGCG